MASSVQEKDIKKLRAAGYLAKKISPVFQWRDRLSLLRSPMRGSFSSPILFAGLGFPFTLLFAASCITTR